MGENRSADFSVVAPILTLVLFLGYGTVWSTMPLKSERPAGGQSGRSEDQAGVQSRLWQDPFDAFRGPAAQERLVAKTEHLLDEMTGPRAKARAATTNEIRRPSRGFERALALAVSVRSNQFAEDVERRIRTRNAVVNGLLATGFEPEDADSLGTVMVEYNRIRPPAAGQTEGADVKFDRFAQPVAYEWFLKPERRQSDQDERDEEAVRAQAASSREAEKPSSFDAVLVMWCADRFSNENPDGFAEAAFLLAPDQDRFASKVCLGPTDSDALSLKHLLSMDAHVTNGATPRWRILSPEATGYSAAEWAKLDAPSDAWYMRRTILEDESLCAALAGELTNHRGLEAGDRVVLVSEADTTYGRRLTGSIVRAFQGVDVKKYFYLRGIDGLLSESGSEASKPDRTTTPEAPGGRPGERALGPSQLDGLRRLCERIAEESPGGEPKAIGVLGSDVYDKLLILQALRARFGSSLFFTTDLDARLVAPATRNLIAAAPFDLRLGSLQRGAMPFRDSYQSSIFYAVLCAVGERRPAISKMEPQIFEIGRTHAVRLTAAKDTSLYPKAESLDFGDQVAGDRSILKATAGALLLLGLAFAWATSRDRDGLPAIAAGATASWRRLPRRACERIFANDASSLAALTAIAWGGAGLGLALAWWVSSREPLRAGGEPFTFLEGVSIWPAELLRYFATILAIGYSVKLLHCWGRERRSIAARFRLENPDDIRGGLKNAFVFLWRFEARTQEKRIPMDQLWREYIMRAEWCWRLLRTGLATLIYMGIAWCVFLALGFPSTPARGVVARGFDFALIMTMATASTWLAFLVWDATRLLTKLIQHMAHDRSAGEYPGACLKAVGYGPSAAPSVLDVQLIGQLTASVGRSYAYPALVYFIMIMARQSLFDHWAWSAPLLIVWGMGLAVTFFAAYVLRRTAGEARRIEIDRLGQHLASLYERSIESSPDAQARQDATEEAKATSAAEREKIAQEIESTRAALALIEGAADGAFAPLREDPVIKSLLLPVAGTLIVGSMQSIAPFIAPYL